MRTSIGTRLLLPVRPTDVGDSDPENLQDIRDYHAQRLLEQTQEASALQRRHTKLLHEIDRMNRMVKNIDNYADKKGIQLHELRTEGEK